MYINRLLNGCGCDMVFIASGCLISRTSERREQVSDTIQPQAIKPYHTHSHYVTCLLHACLYSKKQSEELCNLFITRGLCVYERSVKH